MPSAASLEVRDLSMGFSAAGGVVVAVKDVSFAVRKG